MQHEVQSSLKIKYSDVGLGLGCTTQGRNFLPGGCRDMSSLLTILFLSQFQFNFITKKISAIFSYCTVTMIQMREDKIRIFSARRAAFFFFFFFNHALTATDLYKWQTLIALGFASEAMHRLPSSPLIEAVTAAREENCKLKKR